MRRAATTLSLVCALFLGLVTVASAHTFTRGLNVWSDGVVLTGSDEVRGDVNVIFGTLECDGPATIDGNVTVFFGTFDPLDQCNVRGTNSSVFNAGAIEGLVPWSASRESLDPDRRLARYALLRKLGWDLVVVLAFLLFPVRMRVALDRVEKHPATSALAGAVGLVATLPIAVLLLVTVIGIPLIPIEIAAIFAAAWIGQGAVGLLIGRRLYELVRPLHTPSPLLALCLGLVLMTAAEMLPVIGWAVTALVALVGLGATILAFFRDTAFHGYMPAAWTASPPPSPAQPSSGGPPQGLNRSA